MIYGYLLEIAGSNNSVYDYKDKFRKYYRSMSADTFETKWSITECFLRELAGGESPKYTNLLRAASTWGKADYHVYEFNISMIEHNRNLVKTIMAVCSIWGYCLSIKERRTEITDKIDDAFHILENTKGVQGVYDLFYNDNARANYIYIEDWVDKTTVLEYGSSNIAMEVSIVKALVY